MQINLKVNKKDLSKLLLLLFVCTIEQITIILKNILLKY